MHDLQALNTPGGGVPTGYAKSVEPGERPPGHIATMANRAAALSGYADEVAGKLERAYERNFGPNAGKAVDPMPEPGCAAHAEQIAFDRLSMQLDRLGAVVQALDERL